MLEATPTIAAVPVHAVAWSGGGCPGLGMDRIHGAVEVVAAVIVVIGR